MARVYDNYYRHMENLIIMIQKDSIPDIKTKMNLNMDPILFDRTSTGGKVVDVNEDFKGFMNKFVINNLLQDVNLKMKFLNLVSQTFNTIIDNYNKKNNLSNENAVIFLYKGGNLLRIFYKKFLSNFKNNSTINVNQIVDDIFAGEFGKSDDDYTILINPNLQNFDKIHSDMVYLSYVCLEIIRDQLQVDREYYFDYFKMPLYEKKVTLIKALKKAIDENSFKSLSNPESPYYNYEIVGILLDDVYAPVPPKNQSVEKYLDIINEPYPQIKYMAELYPIKYPSLESVRNFKKFEDDTDVIEHITSSKKNDSFIVPYDSNQAAIYSPKTRTKNMIYVSHNNILITDDPSAITSFVLNRNKINSFLYLKNSGFGKPDDLVYVSAPGELVDVTIGNHEDYGLAYMYKTDLMHNLADYIFTYDDCQFVTKGYSFDYLIHDLENMLFGQTDNKPWLDKKYEKRLKRLLLLGYLKSLVKYGPEETEELFSNIKTYLITANDCFKARIELCYKNIKKPQIPDSNPMHHIISFIGDLYKEMIADPSNTDPNIILFIESITKLTSNIHTVSKAIENYDTSFDPNISQNRIDVIPNYLGGRPRTDKETYEYLKRKSKQFFLNESY